MSGHKLKRFTSIVEGHTAFRRSPPVQQTAFPADCAFTDAEFLTGEQVFAVFGEYKTAKFAGEGHTRETCITITIPFRQTVSVILSAPAVPAADIQNILFPKGQSMATGIWQYSIMPVHLIVCTARIIILRRRHFQQKRFRPRDSPKTQTKKPPVSAILAATRRHKSFMP